MRDLGPLSRRLNIMSKEFKGENYKQIRQLQKKIINHFVEIDPAHKNLNDEFLLALSGQVPIDKLLKRLSAIKGVQLWHQVDQTEFGAKSQQLQGSPTPGATSERLPGTPEEAEQNMLENPLDVLVSDSSDDEDSLSSSSDEEPRYRPDTEDEDGAAVDADPDESSMYAAEYANFFRRESQKLLYKLNDGILPTGELQEIPETAKELQASSTPFSGDTSSYSSSRHNILSKVQSKKEMDLSNVLFNDESDLEEEFINNIQQMTTRVKQVQIKEEEDSASQEQVQ